MATESLVEGAVIDGFRIEEPLDQGRTATLRRVTRRGDDLPLVMKLPRIPGGSDTPVVGFEVEQMILPSLAGPHVPRFVARGDFTGQAYLVMERIAGGSLRTRLDAAPLPIADVVDIGCKVATALQDLHRQHVVHLDVKPGHILFRESGEAVLIDFALARHEQLPDLLEEELELPIGTAAYMAPEQLRYVRDDPRSDLFSLGAVLYHLATGQDPFGDPGSVRGVHRRVCRDALPPRALRPDCPPWLQEIILRCLEVDPARRHPGAAELAFDLQHPERVVLTRRAHRRGPRSAWRTVQRWFAALGRG